MINKLYPYRFQLFLSTQILVLFASLVFPNGIHSSFLSPIFNIGNLLAGLVLLSQKKRTFWLVGTLLLLAILSFTFEVTDKDMNWIFNVFKLWIFLIFQVVVTIELIQQIWKSETITNKNILGLISGFIALGFLSFFICLLIEMYYPGSFSVPNNSVNLQDNLMYFSYITLLTIGYGEIVPVTVLAQKATIFIGLIGQMYLVVLTSIIIGKYIGRGSK